MRLNQFIAHAGICSRRKAEKLILAGKVKVNGAYIKALAYQVSADDKVVYQGQLLTLAQKVYILLNKPTNTITTLNDEQGRRTVIDLLGKLRSRLYPVGRLDRNTTGLLLLTNDGEMAKALSHPASEVPKVYEVSLKKSITPIALAKLKEGIWLKDGCASFDKVELLDKEGKRLSVQLHSGKNRIIRRIFEHLNYPVKALSRVAYAGLTRGELALGAWRKLTKAEVAKLAKWY